MDSLKILLKDLMFLTTYTFDIDGRELSSVIKVDTGCMTSVISMRGLIPDKSARLRIKSSDIKSFRKTGKPEIVDTKGVHSAKGGLNKPIEFMTDSELLNSKTVMFKRKIRNFTVGGFNFGDVDVLVSYDAISESLLGMNILKNYDSSIKRSKDGKVFFELKGSGESGGILDNLIKLLKNGKTIEDAVSVLAVDASEDVVWDCVKEVVKGEYVTEDSWDGIEERLKYHE